MVGREPRRALGQKKLHLLYEGVHVAARLGRERHHGVPVAELLGRLALGADLGIARQVGLGEHADLRRALGSAHLGGHPFVAAPDGLGRIDEHGHDVHILQSLDGARVQLLAEGVLRLVQTGCVHDDHLHVVGGVHGTEAVARRLGRVRCDGDLLAHDGVKKRRLPGVGATDQRHEPALEVGIGGKRPPMGFSAK